MMVASRARLAAGLVAALASIAAQAVVTFGQISYSIPYGLATPPTLVMPTLSSPHCTASNEYVGYGKSYLGLIDTALMWTAAGTPIGLEPGGFRTSVAVGTDGSQQVGYGNGSATGNQNHAILWSSASTGSIDLNPPGFISSEALDVYGTQQVGFAMASTTSSNSNAILWSGTAGNAIDLNPFGMSSSQALGLDAVNQVGTGGGVRTGGNGHALLWSGSAGSAIDLNPSGFVSSAACDVNGNQQVGYGYTLSSNGNSHALVWAGTAASAVDLNPSGFDNSIAFATDGALQVGYAAHGLSRQAMLWSGTAASAIDLQGYLPYPFVESEADFVSGDMVYGFAEGYSGGDYVPVVWIIPEPKSFSLFAITWLTLLGRRVRSPGSTGT